MMIPTIHLNGTSKAELLQSYVDAVAIMRVAIDTVDNVVVNGRDYYPQGAGALLTATVQHRDRVARLVAVRDELLLIAEAIEDGGAKFEPARQQSPRELVESHDRDLVERRQAERRQARHRARDPHCTCNDCISDHSRS